MRFSTKIDWWILLLVLAGIGFVLFSSVVLLIRHEGNDLWLGIGGLLFCLGVIGITVPTRYTIEAKQLLVRAGFFLWRIPLANIVEVHRSNNPLSAPAWSLRRLNVRFINKRGKETYVLISPKKQAEFLQTLLESEPGLGRRGDRLQRLAETNKPGGVG